MKMRKLFAALLAVLMLCSIIPFAVAAESASATITFDNVSKRTEFDANCQVWQENGIVVTNNKDASGSDVADYAKPARFYKNSTLIVEYPGMTKIEFVCNTAAYATALQSSIGAGANAADKVVTVALKGADSFSCVLSGGQVRLDSIAVYGEGGAPVEPDEPDTPDTPDVPSGSLGVVTNPVEGVAYKLGLNQTEKGAVYYFTGAMSGYYGATDTSVDNAVDMYVEVVSGGYKLYFNNGSKQYIKLEQSGTHYNFTFGATGSVFTLDTDLNAFCAPCGDSICYMGTYGTYVTVGCLTEEKLKEGDYIARLYGAEGETPDTPDVPVEPDEPDTPDTPDEPDYDDEIDTTIPYLLGMIQENISTEDVYFLDGGMNGYYMTTTTDEEEAIWVYLEKTNGGYYLYALDEDDAKVYINMVVSGTHVNGVYEYTASTVYNYDWDLYTLVAEVNNDIYAFGTRNDKTYTTMGPVKVSYNGFHADLYYFTDEGDCEHEYESVVIDPTCGEEGATVYTCIYCGYAYDETIPATGEHTYDDEYDADCNACGAVRDVPDKPIEYVGTIEVSIATGAAGETVDVNVILTNNPGIVSAKVKVYFDTTVLNFVAYTDGEFAPGGYSTSDPDLANQNGYFIINWCDALHPDSTANLLATLSFEILAGTQEGSYALVVEIRCDDDVFNAADETVWFSPVDGAVIVVNGLPGDADGNGKVNNRDLGLLQMYLNDDDLIGKNFNEAAVDLDGNGKINNRDLGLLQKLLNQ